MQLFTPKVALLILGLIISFGNTLMAQNGVNEQLALQFYQNQEYDKAADLYKKIYQKQPTPIFYNYYLECLFASEDYKTAKSFVQSVAKKHPDQIKYKVEEAYVIQRSGKQEKAYKAYDKIIKTSLKERQEVKNLADAFMVRGLNNYALKTYQRAKKSIQNPPLHLEIAELHFKMRDYQSMVVEYLDLAILEDQYFEVAKAKLQIIITDPTHNDISEALRTELLRRTQKYPNETVYAEFLYWYSIQKKEFDLALIQAKALDRQFAEDGRRLYNLGSILMSNQEYSLAIEAYQFVLTKGTDSPFFDPASIQILEARFMKITSNKFYLLEELIELERNYIEKLDQYGKNSSTVQMMINLAHLQAFYLNKLESAKSILEPIQNMNNVQPIIKAKAKLQLADMMLFSGEKWSASLLYKQVEKTHKHEPIGYDAKFKAAKFFYYVGEIEWAKAQLKVLSGATSKLIANDALELYLLITENISIDSSYDALGIYAKADLFHFQKQYESANITLDTILEIFPNHSIIDDVYFKKALIALEVKNYELADSLFSQTLSYSPFGSLADNALIERARLNDYILKRPEKALDYYQTILLDYPGSLFTVEARKRYRELKEDI